MCTTCFSSATEEVASDVFGGKMLQILNHAGLALMVSIGHRTGLFDFLREKAPMSAEEIARQTHLQARYVREWLGAMAVGGIIHYFPEESTYQLPLAHARWLTRASGPENLAVISQYIAVMGEVESQVVKAFQEGGGVPYEAYSRFHEVMGEDSGSVAQAYLLSTILPLKSAILENLKSGVRVGEIGCGQGNHLLLMAEAFPASIFHGFDVCEEPIAKARSQAEALGLSNVQLHVNDATYLRTERPFDLVFAFDVVHDTAHPDLVLHAVYESLRPGGTFFMADIDASSELQDNMEHPLGPLFYTISTMHCMTVSLSAGGMGLGTVWGHQRAVQMLKEAGFKEVEILRVEGDIQNCYYVARK
jgi:2-polyprenyl-3-methyl-5-hydroxy-6-metoxy-1,4-benzoquinol methylase